MENGSIVRLFFWPSSLMLQRLLQHLPRLPFYPNLNLSAQVLHFEGFALVLLS